MIALRLLQEFSRAPARFKLRADADDGAVALADVVDVTSDVITDVTGKSVKRRLQTAHRYEPILAHEIDLICQSYGFEGGRY